jgi:hypothetical protein
LAEEVRFSFEIILVEPTSFTPSGEYGGYAQLSCGDNLQVSNSVGKGEAFLRVGHKSWRY